MQETSEESKEDKKGGKKSPNETQYNGVCAEDYSCCCEEDYCYDYDYSEPVYESLSREEQMVTDQTGCEDLELIRKYLAAHDNDVHEAIDALCNYIVLQHKGESRT